MDKHPWCSWEKYKYSHSILENIVKLGVAGVDVWDRENLVI